MDKSSTYAYAILTCLVGVAFWIALAASVDMDYAVTGFTCGDAFTKAIHMPVISVVGDDLARQFLWFLPSAALAIMALFLPRPSLRIAVVSVAIVVSLPAASLLAPILGIGFPLYFISPSDGETWGEAWPVMSAVDFWVILSLCYIAMQWFVRVRKTAS